MVVAAIEGYSMKYGIEARATYDLFRRHDLINLLRSSYPVLHTQSIDESLSFAEDVLARQS
jgi:hypothetical protein